MNKSFKSIIPNATQVIRSSSHQANYNPTQHIHRNEHYEILVIKKGGGTHSIDFINYPVKDNQVYFLRPGQMHQFSPSKQAEFYFIAINNENIQLNSNIALSQFTFFQSFYSSGRLSLNNVDPLIKIIKDIQMSLAPQKRKAHNQEIVISSYIVILLIHIEQLFQKNKKTKRQHSKHSELIQQFNSLIDDPEFTARFVSDYANKLFVTPNYLNECVKRETGYAASHWINQALLLSLKKELLNTNKTLKEIAHNFKFPNAAHLSRFFKHHAGVTAIQFRKRDL